MALTANHFASTKIPHRLHRHIRRSMPTTPFPSPLPLRRLSSENNNPPAKPPRNLWKSLKAPALFGVGLYLGLVAFGGHQETKEGSAYFEGLRGLFWGVDGGNDGRSSGDTK